MSSLNIEVFDKKVVRLQTTIAGDIEIVISNLVDLHTHTGGGVIKSTGRGVQDTTIATIPQNRREIVANFILNA